MAVERVSGAGSLVCPLCGGEASNRSGCTACHLSAREIVGYHSKARHWSEPWGRRAGGRLLGVFGYGAIAAWSWFYFPSTFLFVLPGALVGAYMHGVRKRPLFGAVLFTLIVVVVPLLLWPAGLTGVFSDVGSRI